VRYSREDVMRSTKMMPSAFLKYLLNFSVLILVLFSCENFASFRSSVSKPSLSVP
jgi:hypothetical protein